MRRRNLNRRVTLQRSKSVTHTRVKQAVLRTLARCQWMKPVNICTRTVKCAARPGVVDAPRLMLRSIDHDVADTAIARGVHGDTSRIIRSHGFTLHPKHKHVRNFAGVPTGAKILCFKKTRYGVSFVLSPPTAVMWHSAERPPTAGTAASNQGGEENTHTPESAL